MKVKFPAPPVSLLGTTPIAASERAWAGHEWVACQAFVPSHVTCCFSSPYLVFELVVGQELLGRDGQVSAAAACHGCWESPDRPRLYLLLQGPPGGRGQDGWGPHWFPQNPLHAWEGVNHAWVFSGSPRLSVQQEYAASHVCGQAARASAGLLVWGGCRELGCLTSWEPSGHFGSWVPVRGQQWVWAVPAALHFLHTGGALAGSLPHTDCLPVCCQHSLGAGPVVGMVGMNGPSWSFQHAVLGVPPMAS